MDEVPREQFVEAQFADSAYADQALPIACGQTISQPYVVAYMTEQLAFGRTIACWRSAPARAIRLPYCRGWRARWSPSSATARSPSQARARLAALGYDNVEVVAGDGLIGVPRRAPFDRIVVTAAAATVPQTLVDQLAEGGIMVLPLGPHGGSQHIVKLTKSETALARENLIAVRFVPLLPGQGARIVVFARDPLRIPAPTLQSISQASLNAPAVTILPGAPGARIETVILKALFTRGCFISTSTFVACEWVTICRALTCRLFRVLGRALPSSR